MSLAALPLAMALAAGCAASSRALVPAGTTNPDKFLFDRGMTLLGEKKWLSAREFLKQVVETYTQSPYRPDAKLGVGDTYLGEGSAESVVLAINEYAEFLSFYPTNPRADYAQYKLGVAHARQMRAPQRDQTETRAAVKEFETFLDRYPNSTLKPEVETKLRESRDRLSQGSFEVGLFYFHQKWYPGAIDRFRSVLKDDPAFSGRDGVYFYLGESLLKTRKEAEALPYYGRLIEEFEQSEYLIQAQRRLTELKTQAERKQTTGG